MKSDESVYFECMDCEKKFLKSEGLRCIFCNGALKPIINGLCASAGSIVVMALDDLNVKKNNVK